MTCKTSIIKVTPKDKLINKINNNYINERIRKIEIEEKSVRSCSQVAQKNLKILKQAKQNEAESDDETYVTSNRSNVSLSSVKTMTEAMETTSQ